MRSRLRAKIPDRLSVIVLVAVLALPALAAQDAREIADVRARVRAGLLERINQDRVRHGLGPVELDPEASRLADEYCGRHVENGTRGHFTVDGLSPYMRYSFAGLQGYVLENVAAWSARETFTAAMIPSLALRSHNEMVMEVPPNDGHRRAILDPAATHVGIGVAWGGGEVRFAEVLLRRHVDWLERDQRVEVGQTHRYVARRRDPSVTIRAVKVHYEPFPYRLTRERANRIDTYSMSPEWIEFSEDRGTSALAAAARRQEGEGPRYRVEQDQISFDLGFTNGRGVYTIVLWATVPGSDVSVPVTNLAIVVEGRGD